MVVGGVVENPVADEFDHFDHCTTVPDLNGFKSLSSGPTILGRTLHSCV